MNRITCGLAGVLGLALFLEACATPPKTQELLAPTEAQMKLRNMQTRVFDTGDKDQALRNVMAALQDLGFIIERVNGPLGLVTAGKFSDPPAIDLVELTVTVRPKGNRQVLVRVNALFNRSLIDDPKVYQNFFASLGRSMFVASHPVE